MEILKLIVIVLIVLAAMILLTFVCCATYSWIKDIAFEKEEDDPLQKEAKDIEKYLQKHEND